MFSTDFILLQCSQQFLFMTCQVRYYKMPSKEMVADEDAVQRRRLWARWWSGRVAASATGGANDSDKSMHARAS
jgi:hypothetical protein